MMGLLANTLAEKHATVCINGLVEALVSVRRVQRYLAAPEVRADLPHSSTPAQLHFESHRFVSCSPSWPCLQCYAERTCVCALRARDSGHTQQQQKSW